MERSSLDTLTASILGGNWKQLNQELADGNRTVWTVRSFYEHFLEEYCKPRMRSWRSYECSFKSLNVPGRIGAGGGAVGPIGALIGRDSQ